MLQKGDSKGIKYLENVLKNIDSGAIYLHWLKESKGKWSIFLLFF